MLLDDKILSKTIRTFIWLF